MIHESRRGHREYNPASHQELVDHLINEFNPSFFLRTAGLGHETKTPVFIFGLPRSGTTLLEQILASHSRVHGAGELRLARQSFEAISTATGRNDSPIECVKYLDAGSIMQYRRASTPSGSPRWPASKATRIIDKMPDNYCIWDCWPSCSRRATLIHCRRNLRDVALSCWLTDFRGMTWTNDKAAIASRVFQYQRLMDHWRAVLPVTIHDIDYEETVNDLEGPPAGWWPHAARMGPGLPGAAQEPEDGTNRQPRTGATAGLQELCRPLEALRDGTAGLFAAPPACRSSREACAKRLMSPRKVVSASAGMPGSRTPSSPATGSSPYQVRRTGHPASSAVRLNRSWLRNAHTTPQWSRNQSQSRSNPGPAGARSVPLRATHTLEAKIHATHSQPIARREAGQSARVRPRYSRSQRQPQTGGCHAVPGRQIIRHSHDDEQAIENRPRRVQMDQDHAVWPAHSPGFLQPWDHEDNDQEDHQDGPDPFTGRAGVEDGNQRGQHRQIKR